MSDLPKVERLKLTDFQPDPENANTGSERGTSMIENSIALVGAARSGFADRNRIVLGGNKTQEALLNSGIEDVIVVHTKGDEWVIVQRDDLDLLDDPQHTARLATLFDNRTSEVSLNWQPEVLESYRLQGVPLDKAWTPVELDYTLASLNYAMDTDYVPGETEHKGLRQLVLHFTEEQMNAILSVLESIPEDQCVLDNNQHQLSCAAYYLLVSHAQNGS